MSQDWERIFPDTDHRWAMGLKRTESVAEYFKVEDATGSVLRQRDRWLTSEPKKYAALLPGAEHALAETIELAREIDPSVPVSGHTDFERLLSLGRAWEPDFVWMHPQPDGVHRLIGGVLCFPSSWALEDKLGRPMAEVHGPVPGLNEALGRQIDTFLRKLEPSVPWRRENWGLSRDSEHNHHPSRVRQRLDDSAQIDQVWIRLEHQLLIKLPRSGSVLFGIRVDVEPLSTIRADPFASKRFVRTLSTMSESAARYKGLFEACDTILAMFGKV